MSRQPGASVMTSTAAVRFHQPRRGFVAKFIRVRWFAMLYAREGVDLDRSTLAGRVGAMLRILSDRIAAHVRAGETVHADDTPIPVLDPGRGKTKTGRLWTVVRDERPWRSTASPADPQMRLAARQTRSLPVLETLKRHLDATLARISGKSEFARAIRYITSRWQAFTVYVSDGRLEMSNNAAVRAIRPSALGRKNYLFSGSDAGGERAAVIYTIGETCKMGGTNPQGYLADIINRIADHPINRIDELLPWNWSHIVST